MKNHIALVLLGAVSCLVLPRGAVAQTVITPTDATAISSYFVQDFSVSGADSTIAMTIATSAGNAFARNVWTTSRQGGRGLRLTSFTDDLISSASAVSFNSDNFIGFVQAQPGLTQLAVVGATANVPLGTITPPNLHVDSFSWALSPSRLVFEARDDTQPGFGQDFAPDGLYTLTLPGGTVVPLLACDSSHQCAGPQWSPVDNVIAFTQSESRSGPLHIALINPNGSGLHTIVSGASNPVWSPESGRLAFNCGDDVCTADGDGANVINVTNGASGLVFSQPSWSADETLLGMIGSAPISGPGFGNVYVVSPGGGVPVQATNAGNAASPQWNPLVNELYYICTNNHNDDLCVLNGITAPGGGCDATTCSGCCSNGICLPGNLGAACGLLGASCIECTSGQVCSTNGACVNPTTCNIGSCPNGCCDSSNVCHAGTTTQSCGTGARACERCVNSEICDGAQRTCTAELCSAANCAGCCGADGKCNAGTSNAACGGNGLSCTACNGNAHCSTDRICQTQACDSQSCSTGCCDSNGVCQQGNTATSCGYSGFACLSCGSNSTCDSNSHLCSSPQACSSASCNGCCGSDNACHAGNTSQACGFSGFTCEDCGSAGQCLSGACQ